MLIFANFGILLLSNYYYYYYFFILHWLLAKVVMYSINQNQALNWLIRPMGRPEVKPKSINE